jgi:hypothetical protein
MGAPRTLTEYIETIREGFVCARCGKYVGCLAASEYVPPPYPVAVEDTPADDEARSLVTFAHPQRDGLCISAQEWARGEDEDEDDEVDDD